MVTNIITQAKWRKFLMKLNNIVPWYYWWDRYQQHVCTFGGISLKIREYLLRCGIICLFYLSIKQALSITNYFISAIRFTILFLYIEQIPKHTEIQSWTSRIFCKILPTKYVFKLVWERQAMCINSLKWCCCLEWSGAVSKTRMSS